MFYKERMIKIITCSNCPNKKWFEGLYCIADRDWVIEPKYICKETKDGVGHEVENKLIHKNCPLV
jgi:hypothetical protein